MGYDGMEDVDTADEEDVLLTTELEGELVGYSGYPGTDVDDDTAAEDEVELLLALEVGYSGYPGTDEVELVVLTPGVEVGYSGYVGYSGRALVVPVRARAPRLRINPRIFGILDYIRD